MTGGGGRATAEQLEVIGLVKEVMSALPASSTDGDRETSAAKFQALLESGLWSIGMDEGAGGGGASLDLRLTALTQLGGQWAALAWACAEAHAAVDLLAGSTRFANLAAEVVAGTASICVVDQMSESIGLERADDVVSGHLARLSLVQDPGLIKPHVLVMTGENEAYLLVPSDLEALSPVRTTGLGELYTVQAGVRAPFEAERVLATVMPAGRVRARLYLAGAAIAAGLAAEGARQGAEYAQSRVQFGGPLTKIPMVRAALAAQAMDAATSLSTIRGADDESGDQAASALRGNCERAISVCAAALQSHGGYGYLKDFGIEALLRDAVSLRAAAGVLTASGRASSRFAPEEDRISVPFFLQKELTV